MKNGFLGGGTLAIALLVVIIAAGGVMVWSGYSRGQPIEITTTTEPPLQGEVYIGGEVTSPGIYPWREGDSLEDIIRVAGGVTDNADLNRLQVNIPSLAGGEAPQKVNINTAGAWLLDALPGIGPVRAQAIVDYREQHGPFRNTNELLKVEDIGESTYGAIKDLITVGE